MNVKANKLTNTIIALGIFAISNFAISADNPLPPDGEPLPTAREMGHNLGCKGEAGLKIEEIPIAVIQVCDTKLNYQTVETKSGQYKVVKTPQGEYPDGVVCGRKGRKAVKACLQGKLKSCVEMSNLQERRVPKNYCS